MSQWSTLRSGPLATWKKDEKGPKCRESREPVVHFGEWTTSYMEKDEKGPKCRKSGELVVHSLESGPLATWEKDEKSPKCRESREPVVHLGEWTTSYIGKGEKGPKC